MKFADETGGLMNALRYSQNEEDRIILAKEIDRRNQEYLAEGGGTIRDKDIKKEDRYPAAKPTKEGLKEQLKDFAKNEEASSIGLGGVIGKIFEKGKQKRAEEKSNFAAMWEQIKKKNPDEYYETISKIYKDKLNEINRNVDVLVEKLEEIRSN